MTGFLKQAAIAFVRAMTGRTLLLLSPFAANDSRLLPVRAPYRVTGSDVPYRLLADEPGLLRIELTAPPAAGGRAVELPYSGPSEITLRLTDGAVVANGKVLGTVSAGAPIAAHRFTVALSLRGRRVWERTIGHYQAGSGGVGADYYTGGHYADYEAHAAGEAALVLDAVNHYGVSGSALDVGCATGSILAALHRRGFMVTGIDSSAWAVEQARARLGDAIVLADVDREGVPPEVRARAPFNLIVLAAIIEHLTDPAALIAALGELAAPGAVLLITTSNGDGITHRLLGDDWEGYSDWTHRSVDTVTPAWLRATLSGAGWDPRELRTLQVWHNSVDATMATMREWYAGDARFRQLLAERELGDLIHCVAVKR